MDRTMVDVFPHFATDGGLFSVMIDPPWLGSVNGVDLDILYFGKYGNRLAGGLTLMLTADRPAPNAEVARLLQAKYTLKWKKLWDATNIEYNPLENYSAKEESTDSVTSHDEHTTNTTDDLTYIGTESNKTESGIYGLDSVAASDSDVTNSEKTFGNRQDNRMVTDDKTMDGTETTKHTLTRSGNIGVTTSQQMLESEYVLRDKWEFFEIVFADVNKMLTLPIY